MLIPLLNILGKDQGIFTAEKGKRAAEGLDDVGASRKRSRLSF